MSNNVFLKNVTHITGQDDLILELYYENQVNHSCSCCASAVNPGQVYYQETLKDNSVKDNVNSLTIVNELGDLNY